MPSGKLSPAEDRSDAPAWWWDTALAGAEVFKNALVGQTYLPQSENFPRKFKAIDAAAIVPKSP
jgi:hypothetical protein